MFLLVSTYLGKGVQQSPLDVECRHGLAYRLQPPSDLSENVCFQDCLFEMWSGEGDRGSPQRHQPWRPEDPTVGKYLDLLLQNRNDFWQELQLLDGWSTILERFSVILDCRVHQLPQTIHFLVCQFIELSD